LEDWTEKRKEKKKFQNPLKSSKIRKRIFQKGERGAKKENEWGKKVSPGSSKEGKKKKNVYWGSQEGQRSRQRRGEGVLGKNEEHAKDRAVLYIGKGERGTTHCNSPKKG